ncbi:MAG TPA: dienelactone hydrolase family protein [Terrimicrobiaceae bacterium]|nr:dienelactone hydrolase family protein [Terrimicrobiaceae bacterium]
MRPLEFFLGLSAGLILLAAWAGWMWVLPAFALPRPPGPHPVGTTTAVVTTGTGGPISLRIWYPASGIAGCRRAPYATETDPVEARFASGARKAKTHSFVSAPPAPAPPGGWPAVLYSPSWEGSLIENTTLCEALASEGFVVIAIARPGGPSLPPLDFQSEESVRSFERAMATELQNRTDRVLEVFAALPAFGSGGILEDPLRLPINAQAVGVMGYSFGGAVAAEACVREPRLRCGADLDGTLFGQAAREGAPQPFLFVTDTAPIPSEADRRSADPAIRRQAEFYAGSFLDIERWLAVRGGWMVRLDGVQHANFSDRPLYSPIRRWTGAGPRNPRETLSVITGCTAEFFQTFLRGENPAGKWQTQPGTAVEKHPAP